MQSELRDPGHRVDNILPHRHQSFKIQEMSAPERKQRIKW